MYTPLSTGVPKGVQRVKRIAVYARVSSSIWKDGLDKHVEALKLWVSKNFRQAEYIVVTDVASGLKEDRRGLRKLIEMARRREIDAVVVAYKDRLTTESPTLYGGEEVRVSPGCHYGCKILLGTWRMILGKKLVMSITI